MKKLLLLLALSPFALHAQIINTIAGTGVAGFSGDGGSALVAKINNPSGLAWDHAGNMYVTDHGNHIIRKVTPAGIISTFAGTPGVAGYSGDGGPATAATFNDPVKLTMDNAGNLYVGDAENNVLRKINPAGIITTVVGTGSAGLSGDGGPATAAELSYVAGMIFDPAGNMYVTDYRNFRIRKVTPAGIISTYAGTSGGFAGDGGPATAAQLYANFGMVFDAAQNMYIADASNHRVRKITPAGIISTYAGTGVGGFSGDGGPASAAKLYNPAGITIDAAGNLYVGDQMNERIRKITPAGIISTITGTGTATFGGDGGLATAASISGNNEAQFNPAGNFVLCDNANHRVREIDGLGSCAPSATTTSGNRLAAYGGTVKFYVSTSAPSPAYQWQKYVAPNFVYLTSTSPYSGVTTDTLTITGVPPSLDSTIYRCVVVYGDGCSDTSTTDTLYARKSLGISGVSESGKVTVYPNPAHDFVDIHIDGNTNNASVQVYNQLGSLLLNNQINGTSSRVDISHLPVGLYLLRLYTDGETIIKKIYKQ